MLIPAVLGSAGTLFKCLDWATKEMVFPNAEKQKLYSKLRLHSMHTLQSLVPKNPNWKGNVQSRPQKRGEV
jgi:hypothetical protein